MSLNEKTFKLVQVGCGNMAKRWVKYALSRPDIEIVALVDINQTAAEAMAKEFGIDCLCSVDLEQAIRETGADLVFDVTIPEVHKKIVMKAVEWGCDVLGEKPMAANLADAIEMEQFVKQQGRSYSVMQNRRFTKQIREARGMIDEGRIGEPGQTTADFFLGPHFGGFRDMMDNPLLLDMAIHTFDQARYLLQADPVSVYCHEFNPPYSWYKGNASAICIFELADGSVFSYNGSWCAEGEPTSWHGSWRVVGSKGTLIWDGENDPYCSTVQGEIGAGSRMQQFERIAPTSIWTGKEGHDACFDEMMAALKEGRKAETDCSDNLMSMAMVFAAIESAKRREVIPISIK
ncbi:oxidoreductase [Paenibacillus sp. FSL H8-0548]|uniref:Gfo/Idh/MocA family protein n=1 Tax=Paenibacillus sp. FSL H8-0548 TaxID=1920422 RepID=UPI00096F6074|nr:Gfo/Idh/MocA family oxidoreductase [Paenibacillus sp. FSL H8-0548]OMF23229.1 oxidoreductase [Paenibacillus sp. FSL H8-0548]